MSTFTVRDPLLALPTAAVLAISKGASDITYQQSSATMGLTAGAQQMTFNQSIPQLNT